jgi:hypothetical protein
MLPFSVILGASLAVDRPDEPNHLVEYMHQGA